MSEFSAGFLAMIKPYNLAQKAARLSLLELLAIKEISYSWPSVRATSMCTLLEWADISINVLFATTTAI